MGSHKPKSIAELISIIEVSLQKVKDSESTVTGEKALAWAKQIKSHKKIDLNTNRHINVKSEEIKIDAMSIINLEMQSMRPVS